ncbi:hypothetical protein BDQ17DRAFT_1326179 [Cyathus striatus]|nr:hypothetical protein BDQ17DRAFT_1326179 [Cyathus striatus]
MSSPVASTSVSTASQSQRTITGAHLPLPSPMRVIVHDSRSADMAEQGLINPIDDFFGYTFNSSRTQDSRHDRRVSEVPPPYAEESGLPEYTLHAPEPVTLAMYLFKFGFLFPPFWLFGAFILLSPLREPPATTPSSAWMPEKTEAEKQEIIANMRKIEVKWAWRCVFALISFILVACGVGIAIWAATK